MKRVTLEQIYKHPIAQKYLRRAGMAHAISVAYYAFDLALEHNVNPDLATKAGFLHDIGHFNWYTNGEWDYDRYNEFDIHSIKGAERAHKLLIRLGENPKAAKEISLAILLHTESSLPNQELKRNALQQVVYLADEKDKQPGHLHHYKKSSQQEEIYKIKMLDEMVSKWTTNAQKIAQ